MKRRMRVQVREWGDTERMIVIVIYYTQHGPVSEDPRDKKSSGNKAEHEWDVGIRNGNGDTAERNSSDVRT
jgi:hypothetical protein